MRLCWHFCSLEVHEFRDFAPGLRGCGFKTRRGDTYVKSFGYFIKCKRIILVYDLKIL